MAIDTLPEEFQVPARSEIKARWLRSYLLRDPSASTAPGEQPDVSASVMADQLMPVYAAAQKAGNAVASRNKSLEDLSNEWTPRGLPPLEAQGAVGYVLIGASAAGGPIYAGDVLREPNSQIKYECTEERLKWFDQQWVPIRGVDTGPQTNLAPGTVLQWDDPGPGIDPNCTVAEQSDGSGLTDGRNAETVEEYRQRIDEYQANPPAGDNDAEIQLVAEKTPGLAIQKAFTYPSILGLGSTAIICVLRPARPGAERRPTDLQRASIETWVVGQLGDTICYFPSLLADPVDLIMDVKWSEAASDWADLAPWPPRETSLIQVAATPAPTAESFRLEKADASYTGVTQPVVGQTIAFLDRDRGKFMHKVIGAVSGTGPWDITVSTALSESDITYTPEVWQPACPWSDSLDSLVTPIVKTLDTLGPGEMIDTANLFDDSKRLRRQPTSPAKWPYALTNKNLNANLNITELEDYEVITGYKTTQVGTPGVIAYIMELQYIAAFPLVS